MIHQKNTHSTNRIESRPTIKSTQTHSQIHSNDTTIHPHVLEGGIDQNSEL